MAKQSAEDAAHAHASAVVAGDVGPVILGMTPDGFAKAVEIGNTNWDFVSYDVLSQSNEGDDPVFEIAYVTTTDRFTIRYRFREIDGAWKVTDMERLA